MTECERMAYPLCMALRGSPWHVAQEVLLLKLVTEK